MTELTPCDNVIEEWKPNTLIIFLSIYRLFHLIITLGFQILIMRDMEKLTGAIRMAIIYIGTGMAGNLASCIFVPYQVEVS